MLFNMSEKSVYVDTESMIKMCGGRNQMLVQCLLWIIADTLHLQGCDIIGLYCHVEMC